MKCYVSEYFSALNDLKKIFWMIFQILGNLLKFKWFREIHLLLPRDVGTWDTTFELCPSPILVEAVTQNWYSICDWIPLTSNIVCWLDIVCFALSTSWRPSILRLYKLNLVMIPFGSAGGNQETFIDCGELTTDLMSIGEPGTKDKEIWLTTTCDGYELLQLQSNQIDCFLEHKSFNSNRR